MRLLSSLIFLCVTCFQVTAQCVNPNTPELVVNGNFTNDTMGFTSGYSYYVSGPGVLFPTNVFTITTDPHIDHSGGVSYADHTTGTGKMFAANGASTPVDLWCENITVKPNTYYNFSAWLAGWSSDSTDNLPEIQFEINGILLDSVFNFPHHDGVWTQFATSWYSGNNTSASICISDQQTASYGNDFSMDDISFKACGCGENENAVTASPDTICAGKSSILSATGGSGYLWKRDISLSCDTCPEPVAHPTVTTMYIVTISNGLCSSIDSIVITVHDLPLTPTLITNDSIICSPGYARINISEGDYSSYKWSDGDTTDFTNVTSTGKYWVTVSDNNGCAAISVKQGITILPVVSKPLLSAGDTLICSSNSAFITVVGSYKSYLWNNNDTTNFTDVNEAGDYWVTVTDANGCSAVSDHKNISFYPVPSVSIIVLGDTLISYGAVTYQWYFNGQSILGATGATYIAQKTGEYAVQITDNNGCAELSNYIEVAVTGIGEIYESNLFSIYPDPFTDMLFIKNAGTSIERVELFDVLGRVCEQKDIGGVTGELTIDVSALHAGSYFVKVTTANVEYIQTMIKQ